MSLQAYIVRRLIFLFFTLIGISLITFMLSRLAPGDPARLMAGMNASAEQVENIRARLGLDRPLSEQYLLYMRDLLSRRLGRVDPQRPSGRRESAPFPSGHHRS
ncbi:MAG: hypothetical protein HC802_20405 [Caldilineaceae bacterium]|nr:hypothetical protein [Caldilineaceae bacterium]